MRFETSEAFVTTEDWESIFSVISCPDQDYGSLTLAIGFFNGDSDKNIVWYSKCFD